MGYVFALARSVDVDLDNQRQRDLAGVVGDPASGWKARRC